jgi:hypothetical protein
MFWLTLITALLLGQRVAPAGYKCAPDQVPSYRAGFAALEAELGVETMGVAWGCEFPDPRATGDILQVTFKGLAFWRKSTNTPTWTDGSQHFALTPEGLVNWTGTSVDPPADAVPGRGIPDPRTVRALCERGVLIPQACIGFTD